MRTEEQIDFVALKTAAKELNDLGIGAEKVKLIGSEKVAMMTAFVTAVESVKEEDEGKLTESIINQYNYLTEATETVGGETKPAEAPVETSTGKPAKKPKPAKEKKERTPKGEKVILCSKGSSSGNVEELLCRPEGASMEEMTALRGAVSSLLNSIRKSGHVIERHENRYYYRADGKLVFPPEVKPAKAEKPAKPAKEEKPPKPAKEPKPAK